MSIPDIVASSEHYLTDTYIDANITDVVRAFTTHYFASHPSQPPSIWGTPRQEGYAFTTHLADATPFFTPQGLEYARATGIIYQTSDGLRCCITDHMPTCCDYVKPNQKLEDHLARVQEVYLDLGETSECGIQMTPVGVRIGHFASKTPLPAHSALRAPHLAPRKTI